MPPFQMPDFRVIPVMDVMGGGVVRAIAGRREEYRPLTSCVTNSTDPLQVAADLRDATGTDELYLADLDGIMGGIPNVATIHNLARRGHRMWVDVGIRHLETARNLKENGVAVVVVGLETLPRMSLLDTIVAELGPDSVAFSVDLKEGLPLGDLKYWQGQPEAVVSAVCRQGVRRMIVLDLSRVGMNAGTGSEYICAWTKNTYPHVEVIVGGGVRGPEDLPKLKAAGASAALVASAIHDGKFGFAEGPQ